MKTLSLPRLSYSSKTQLMAKSYGLLVSLLIIFLSFTIIDTVYLECPVEEVNSNLKLIHSSGIQVIEITREFKLNNKYASEIIGELISDDQVVSLPNNRIRLNDQGVYKRLIVLPSNINGGRWCVDSEIHYNYGLSLKEHIKDVKTVCIDIRS